MKNICVQKFLFANLSTQMLGVFYSGRSKDPMGIVVVVQLWY